MTETARQAIEAIMARLTQRVDNDTLIQIHATTHDDTVKALSKMLLSWRVEKLLESVDKSKLPLGQRLALEAGSAIKSQSPLGADAMIQYLYGKGEPSIVPLSEEAWERLISQANGRWKQGRNPRFPNWEYADELYATDKGASEGDVWNLLGQTTLRRRIAGQDTLYNIAGPHEGREAFDFVVGRSKTPVVGGNRFLPGYLQNILAKAFPSLTRQSPVYPEKHSLVTDIPALTQQGTPFPIIAEYIRKGR